MYRTLRHIGFVALLVGLWEASLTAAQPWPQWRGPHRDGTVAQQTMPETWPDELQLEWRVEVGTGHATPLVMDGRVYLHTRLDDQETASCLDLGTGEPIWRESYPAPYTMNPAARGHGKGPKSTPLLHRGYLCTLGISGILSCFEAGSGDLEWQRDFADEFDKTAPLYGTAMSPIAVGEFVIAHVGGHGDGALMAFDLESGETVWRWDGDGPAYTSPILVEIDGVSQLVTQSQNHSIGIEVGTGELLWSIPYTTMYDQNIVTPLSYEGDLIFSGLGNGTERIRATRQDGRWVTERMWHQPKVSMYMSSPILVEHLIFGLMRQARGRFAALDARSGEEVWTSEDRQGENAAILTDGRTHVLCLTTEAILKVFEREGISLRLIAQYTVAENPTWAHPVFLKRGVLIKDESTLSLWAWE